MHPCPALRPRWDRRTRPSRFSGAAFRSSYSVGSHNSAFEAQSRGLAAPCVRFAESVALPHATLGTRLLASFAGRDFHPLRINARFQLFNSSFLLAQA